MVDITFDDALRAFGGAKMVARQEPLMADYWENPENAAVTDFATTRHNGVAAAHPLHTAVTPDKGGLYPISVHKAVGGESDFATPGDLLCAAIASCLDSTIRVIANRLGIPLTALKVDVAGEVDVRGALGVCEKTPVGFQQFRIDVELDSTADLPEASRAALLSAAEHSCIVLQTIRADPKISITTRQQENAAIRGRGL